MLVAAVEYSKTDTHYLKSKVTRPLDIITTYLFDTGYPHIHLYMRKYIGWPRPCKFRHFDKVN